MVNRSHNNKNTKEWNYYLFYDLYYGKWGVGLVFDIAVFLWLYAYCVDVDDEVTVFTKKKKITSNVSKQNAARESKELWEMYGEFFGDNPSSCLWISYLKKSKRKSMRCWLCLFWKGEFFSPLNVILSLLVNLCLAFPKKKIHNFIRIIWVNSGSCVVLQAIFGMVLVTDCIHQVL